MKKTFEQLLTEKYLIPREMHKKVIDLTTWLACPSVVVGIVNETTETTMHQIAWEIADIQGRDLDEEGIKLPLIYKKSTGRYNTEYDLPFENEDFHNSVVSVRKSRKEADFKIV